MSPSGSNSSHQQLDMKSSSQPMNLSGAVSSNEGVRKSRRDAKCRDQSRKPRGGSVSAVELHCTCRSW